ncbi:MAG: Asp-tRNA(Asn)/Glu-tRNA(Gln) amidotransferase subunit GatB [Bacilli bacterium]|nr:Asp-tRNA(Asn)/Glu-tRNA(Gln) amidotransferase subunit GatB [Bacilli bacterium]
MFNVNIGLEFHIQLKTHQKLFSNAINSYEKEANKNVSLFDVGFPGTLPILNTEAVKLAIRACYALNMEINRIVRFDRKHYFYSDLPKGYQITQEDEPIGRNGYIVLKDDSKIQIERIHIEEDTCKQIHKANFTYLDFNRCDAPLIEVVTSPCIKTASQAKEVAQELKRIVTSLNISDGKMEEGSFRVDVNVSLSKADNNGLGTKVEIKNINTFENIEKAVNYEINRQKALLLDNKEVKQETLRFDEKLQSNVLMRAKEDFVDYRIFADPNIPPYRLSEEFINSIINEKQNVDCTLLSKIKSNNAKILKNDSALLDFFEKCQNYFDNQELLSNFLCNELKGYLKNKIFKTIDEIIKPSDLTELLKRLEDKKMSKNDVLKCIQELNENKVAIDIVLKSQDSHKNLSDEEIECIIGDVINENFDAVNDYKSGKNKALGFLIKKTIDKTGNNINIKLVSSLIVKNIKGE